MPQAQQDNMTEQELDDLIANKRLYRDKLVKAKQLIRRNESIARKVGKEITKNFDSKKKQFDGKKFGEDFMQQLALALEAANVVTGGEHEVEGNLTEYLYNLFNK